VKQLFRPTAALGAVLFALLGLAACGGVSGNSVVSVNGTAITRDTFDHWMGVAAHSSATSTTGKPVIPEPPEYTACVKHLEETTGKPVKGSKAPSKKELKSQCETQYKSLQSEVLGFLISSSWVLGEGNALNVKLSDAEVKKQFTKIKLEQFPKPAEFEKFLSSSGQTVSDLLLRVKLNLLSQKIQKQVVKKKATVSHAEVVKYYEENKERYGTPEKRNVRIVLLKTESAAAGAKKEIESGKSFASVAKTRSVDPTSRANGGLINGVIKGEEEKALSEAMFSAKLHALGGPVKTPFGYYVFQVEGITPGTSTPLKSVEASVKQQLVATKQQKALTDFVKSFKDKWKAKTECRSGFVVADCKEYKAPKGAASSTTTE
jgi:foldase protein PrsA